MVARVKKKWKSWLGCGSGDFEKKEGLGLI